MHWVSGRRAINDAYEINLLSRDPFSAGGTRTVNSTTKAANAFEAGKIISVVEKMDSVGKGWLMVAYGPEYSLANFRSVYQYLWAKYEATDDYKARKSKTQAKLLQLLQWRIDDLRFRSRCYFVDKRRDTDFKFSDEYDRPKHPKAVIATLLGTDPKHFDREFGFPWDFWKQVTDELDKQYLPPVSAVVERAKEAIHNAK